MSSESHFNKYRNKSTASFIIGLILWFLFCLTVAIGVHLSAIMYQLDVSLGRIFSWDFLSHPIVISDVLWVVLYTSIFGAIARFIVTRFIVPIAVKLFV